MTCLNKFVYTVCIPLIMLQENTYWCKYLQSLSILVRKFPYKKSWSHKKIKCGPIMLTRCVTGKWFYSNLRVSVVKTDKS